MPETKAVVISTAGDSNAIGSISQSFTVPPGYGTISGRVRFLSNEWPDWYGTQYNDTYLVRISTSGGSSILASGNVNSSSWSSGILGYNGIIYPGTDRRLVYQLGRGTKNEIGVT